MGMQVIIEYKNFSEKLIKKRWSRLIYTNFSTENIFSLKEHMNHKLRF